MADTKKIKTALISVYNKDGLDELLEKLNMSAKRLKTLQHTPPSWVAA